MKLSLKDVYSIESTGVQDLVTVRKALSDLAGSSVSLRSRAKEWEDQNLAPLNKEFSSLYQRRVSASWEDIDYQEDLMEWAEKVASIQIPNLGTSQ